MKAIILSAGIGSRIRPLTNNTPKSLLKVGNKTILQKMVENIKNVGINDIAIVTGYLEIQIRDYTKQIFPNINFTFIRNDKYETTNTGYSLMLTKNFVKGDSFVKFDADVVFEKKVLEKLVKNPHKSCLCIDKNIHLKAEEVKVIVDKNNKVVAVGKKLDPKKASGESIGIEKIDSQAGKTLFGELSQLMKNEANYNEYYDDSYTTLVQKGVPFHAVDITGLKWAEIDTHEDYQKALELFS